MIKKRIIIPVLTLSLSASIFGTSQLGHIVTTPHTQALVQILSQTFGLDPRRVQSVFDQYSKQEVASLQKNTIMKINIVVNQGKLTTIENQVVYQKSKNVKSENIHNTSTSIFLANAKYSFQMVPQTSQNWASFRRTDPKYLLEFGIFNRWSSTS